VEGTLDPDLSSFYCIDNSDRSSRQSIGKMKPEPDTILCSRCLCEYNPEEQEEPDKCPLCNHEEGTDETE
jgi:uncharacterized CHY-type Zn-finger protein